jgi:ATP:corrinoid adenosyltransferase
MARINMTETIEATTVIDATPSDVVILIDDYLRTVKSDLLSRDEVFDLLLDLRHAATAN